MSDHSALLPEKVRRQLEPLMLVAHRVRAGAMKGERRSVKRGTSLEFADYRNYVPGDDLRRLDWNVYARSDRPTVKLMEDEEDLSVHLLLDTSASMNWPQDGASEHNKLLFGQRLLAGLAYISLTSNDRLRLAVLSTDSAGQFGPVRGRGQTVAMMRYVTALSAGGTTDLNATLRAYALRAGRPGLCIVISDLLSPPGYVDGLNALLGAGHEVVVAHVLSPDELTPPLAGDLRLIDSETGTAQEISIDPALRAAYQQRISDWRDDIRATCGKRGAHYLPLSSDTTPERVMLYDLRRLGVVR